MTGAIVAVGDAVVDALFSGPPADPQYVHTTGGGSVWNVAAILASRGLAVRAKGTVGDDWRGDIAVESLAALGVDVALDHQIGRLTRLICQVPNPALGDLFTTAPPFRLLGDCVICERPAPTRRCSALRGRAALPEAVSVLVADRVSDSRVETAAAVRSAGGDTVLDLGRVGFVRYLEASYLRPALEPFSLIVMPRAVARAVETKLGLPVESFYDAGIKSVIVVTDGPKGTRVTDQRNARGGSVHLPSPELRGPVVDEIGAGDVQLASVIGSAQQDERRLADTELDVIAAYFADAGTEVAGVLMAIGARGHLERPATVEPRGWAGRPLSALRGLVAVGQPCPLCGAGGPTVPRRRPTVGARRNVSMLARRVTAALRRQPAIDECVRALEVAGLTVCVGAGGSYAAALFAGLAFNRNGAGLATVMRPMEFLLLRPPANQVFAVSYSGGGPDIGAVVQRATAVPDCRTVLLTSRPTPGAAAGLEGRVVVAAYGDESQVRERGFVSISATVAPAAVIAAAICGVDEVLAIPSLAPTGWHDTADIATGLLDAVTSMQPIEVLGSGWATPAMFDFESKLTESGFGVARLHEAKDFSHGRFMSVLGRTDRPTALLLGVGKETGYEQQLRLTLAEHTNVVTLRSTDHAALGALDLLVLIQHTVEQMGRLLGRDISRPRHIDPDGLALYNWSWGLDD